jgi:predicted nucleotidyltransferase component of viral defense system
MDPHNRYRNQVQLLVRLLPVIAEHPCFALKGGTAINLFYHDLPRLSVDIDLAFVPADDRSTALDRITSALQAIEDRIKHLFPDSQCRFNGHSRLVVSNNNSQVKIEVNEVLRGTVHPVQLRHVSEATESEFGYAEMQVLAFEDLYAGKICAALDRQHPRDLFDCQPLLRDRITLDRSLLDTFIVYLISHNRPIAELLRPRFADLTSIFEREFRQMPSTEVSLQSLETTRSALIHAIHGGLTADQKAFLLSFKSLQPQWGLLPLPDIEKLPAVRWKLQNIAQMPPEQHQKAVGKLEKTLEQIGSG